MRTEAEEIVTMDGGAKAYEIDERFGISGSATIGLPRELRTSGCFRINDVSGCMSPNVVKGFKDVGDFIRGLGKSLAEDKIDAKMRDENKDPTKRQLPANDGWDDAEADKDNTADKKNHADKNANQKTPIIDLAQAQIQESDVTESKKDGGLLAPIKQLWQTLKDKVHSFASQISTSMSAAQEGSDKYVYTDTVYHTKRTEMVETGIPDKNGKKEDYPKVVGLSAHFIHKQEKIDRKTGVIIEGEILVIDQRPGDGDLSPIFTFNSKVTGRDGVDEIANKEEIKKYLEYPALIPQESGFIQGTTVEISAETFYKNKALLDSGEIQKGAYAFWNKNCIAQGQAHQVRSGIEGDIGDRFTKSQYKKMNSVAAFFMKNEFGLMGEKVVYYDECVACESASKVAEEYQCSTK